MLEKLLLYASGSTSVKWVLQVDISYKTVVRNKWEIHKKISKVPGTWQVSINITCSYLYCFWKKKTLVITVQKSIESAINLSITNTCIMLNVNVFSLDWFIYNFFLFSLLMEFIFFLVIVCSSVILSWRYVASWAAQLLCIWETLFLSVFLNDGLGGGDSGCCQQEN